MGNCLRCSISNGMKEYEFFEFRVEVDEISTRDWYEGAERWDCECGHCRNFLALAQERALPAPVLEILDSLGIPPEKATYVCELYRDEGGHYYEFSYRIAGRILSGDETASVPQEWGEGICYHEIYPYGAPGFPEPYFDLGFFITLPWVLEVQE